MTKLQNMKGEVAGKTPTAVDIKEGESYFWCTCGKSENQPFCDGKHKGSDFTPLVLKAEESKTVYLCQCKQTNGAPFCDGSHNSLA